MIFTAAARGRAAAFTCGGCLFAAQDCSERGEHTVHRIRRAGIRVLAGLLCAAGLTGCAGRANSFTWRAERVPGNLDPQLAAESPEIIAVTHLFSGLYRLDAEGVPQLDCAESAEVSQDGLTWTFHLKDGMRYRSRRGEETDYAVTAEDFVFGLQRVFLPETGSPYAEALGGIAGSEVLLAGGDPGLLGVRALDGTTLEIILRAPDEAFAQKLCLPGAMPCDQEFFESTGGAYGLGMGTTIGNGSFYLYNWTESGLFLRRAAGNGRIDSLRIVLAQDDASAPGSTDSGAGSAGQQPASQGPVELITAEKCSAALYDGPLGTGLTELPYTTTTWGLVFRCSEGPLESAQLRQALGAVAYGLTLELPEGCAPAEGLTPPDMDYGAHGTLPRLGDPVQLYREALAELGTAQITGLTVLVPEGYAQLFGQVNQEWQRQLSLFCKVQELPLAELLERLAAGDYEIALAPFTPGSSDPASLLRQFGPEGVSELRAPEFLRALEEAEALTPGSDAWASAMQTAEQTLLASCPVLPLFYQTKALLVAPGIEGVVFSPFAPAIDVTWAVRG